MLVLIPHGELHNVWDLCIVKFHDNSICVRHFWKTYHLFDHNRFSRKSDPFSNVFQFAITTYKHNTYYRVNFVDF